MTRILGLKDFIDIDQTTKDILDDFKARKLI